MWRDKETPADRDARRREEYQTDPNGQEAYWARVEAAERMLIPREVEGDLWNGDEDRDEGQFGTRLRLVLHVRRKQPGSVVWGDVKKERGAA